MVLAQNLNAVNRVFTLQKKVLRIINFQPPDCRLSPLFKRHNLLKFENKLQLENALLVSEYLINTIPSIFGSHFVLMYTIIPQLPALQVNYSNFHSKLIYMEKSWFQQLM